MQNVGLAGTGDSKLVTARSPSARCYCISTFAGRHGILKMTSKWRFPLHAEEEAPEFKLMIKLNLRPKTWTKPASGITPVAIVVQYNLHVRLQFRCDERLQTASYRQHPPLRLVKAAACVNACFGLEVGLFLRASASCVVFQSQSSLSTTLDR